MSRNYGTHGGRPSLGGLSTGAPASIGKYAPSNSILLPSVGPALERGQIKQALFDILAVGFAFLFISIAGVGLAFAFFVGFFVKL